MRRVFLIVAILLLLLALALRTRRIADLGIQADEGAYLVIIEGLLQGKLPYRDLFLNHPPGMFWLMGGFFRLTTPHLFAGRWLTQLASVLTVATLIACAKLALPKGKHWWGGLLAGLLFALSPLAIFWSRFILLEHFETLFATLSVALILLEIRKGNGRFWLLSGFMAGLAILVKISGLILIPVMIVSLLIVYWHEWLKLGRAISLWILGVVAVSVAALALLATQGIFDDFGHYLSGADRLAPFENLLQKVTAIVDWHDGWLLLLLAIIGAVFILLFRRRALLVGLVWAMFEVGALLLPERLEFSYGGFSHYALPVIAALSLLAGSGVVWGWQQTNRSRVWRWGVTVVLLFCLLFTVWPKWTTGLDEVVRQSEYPQLLADELLISEAVQAVTAEDEAILVFGNSGFYHWAERPLSTMFYHIPAYFLASPLRDEVEADLTTQLADGSLAALLVSRMHMEDRLSSEISSAMWQNWDAVALFSYSYQRDMFLFLPKTAPKVDENVLASFAGGLELQGLNAQLLGDEALLVNLSWLTTEPIMSEYIVFVHLLTENGNLISQSDAVPGMGFRPVTSWSSQELVSDRHWLQLPEGFSPEGMQLSVGMYRADNGERLPLLLNGSENIEDSFIVSLSEID